MTNEHSKKELTTAAQQSKGQSPKAEYQSSVLSPQSSVLKIGVLALQGDFAEHIAMLHTLGAETVEVRHPEQLAGLDGLVIPGGESTAIGKLAELYGLKGPIAALAQQGLPIYGTCAGMIMLSRDIGDTAALIEGRPQSLFGVMDVKVRRNAFGRAIDSFETAALIPALGEPPFPMVFIRAPYIESVGRDVEVLAKLAEEDAPIVAAQQRNLLVSAFHPELTEDTRFHAYFLKMVEEQRGQH